MKVKCISLFWHEREARIIFHSFCTCDISLFPLSISYHSKYTWVLAEVLEENTVKNISLFDC